MNIFNLLLPIKIMQSIVVYPCFILCDFMRILLLNLDELLILHVIITRRTYRANSSTF